MKPTLTELWNGNIHPISDADRLAENERELIGYIECHFQNLNSQLDEKGKETLKNLTECYDELLSHECEAAFIEGFSLAAKILTEATA